MWILRSRSSDCISTVCLYQRCNVFIFQLEAWELIEIVYTGSVLIRFWDEPTSSKIQKVACSPFFHPSHRVFLLRDVRALKGLHSLTFDAQLAALALLMLPVMLVLIILPPPPSPRGCFAQGLLGHGLCWVGDNNKPLAVSEVSSSSIKELHSASWV